MKSRAREEVGPGPKLIVQYRTSAGRAYEFQSSSMVVALHISLDTQRGDAESWHARAEALQQPHALPHETAKVVEGWGSTPAEALRTLACACGESSGTFIPFDWEAAAKELRLVRGI